MRDFAARFDNFIGYRQLDVSARLSNCQHYQAARQQVRALEEEIRSRLGPEGRDLFNRWDAATGMQMGIAADEHYVQGLRDGLALAVILVAPGGKTVYAMIEEMRGRAPDQETAPSDR
ncbi:MAG: hypothetical protein AB1816_00220 [Bacillota bacterium]